MIDLSEVITDPDLGEPFVIWRSTGGKFVAGGWQEDEPNPITTWGVVTVANAQEVTMVPEGDRIKGVMKVYSTERLYGTHADPTPGTSDIVEWNSERFRIMNVLPRPNRGFWTGYAVRLGGK